MTNMAASRNTSNHMDKGRMKEMITITNASETNIKRAMMIRRKAGDWYMGDRFTGSFSSGYMSGTWSVIFVLPELSKHAYINYTLKIIPMLNIEPPAKVLNCHPDGSTGSP
jgi:hypothetical protein